MEGVKNKKQEKDLTHERKRERERGKEGTQKRHWLEVGTVSLKCQKQSVAKGRAKSH